MAKAKTVFFCTNCGNETPKWMGRCPGCGAFNTMEEHIEKPADVLKVGEEVTAKVVDFNEEDKKISLSIKALFAPEPAEEVAEEAPVEDDDADVVSVDIDAVIASEAAEEE